MKFQKFPFKIEKQYRLPGYNYSQDAYYFITICTKDRLNYFGEIINNTMELSQIGEIVNKFWTKLPKKFDGIKLDEYCIMPNHFHGILIICRNAPGECRNAPRNGRVPLNNNNNNKLINNINSSNCISMNAPVLRPRRVPTIKPLDVNSVSSIINHFKGSVKKSCQANNLNFAWQSRFHDRIIRNEKEYFAIKRYIQDNPKNWEKDRNNHFIS